MLTTQAHECLAIDGRGDGVDLHGQYIEHAALFHAVTGEADVAGADVEADLFACFVVELPHPQWAVVAVELGEADSSSNTTMSCCFMAPPTELF